MSRREGDAQININVTEELREAISKAAEECGLSRNSYIIRVLEEERIRSYGIQMPNEEAELEEFLAHSNALSRCFREALDRSINAVEIAENGVQDRLKALNSMSDTIEEQKADIASKSEQIETLRAEADEAKRNMERAENEAAASREALSQIEEENKILRSERDKARSDLIEARENLASIEKDHAKELQELFSTVMRDVATASRGVPPED